MRRVAFVFSVLVGLTAWAETSDATAGWHRVVGLLQYVAGDYANAVATKDAAELEEQKGFADEVVAQLESQGEAAAPYLERAKSVRDRIARGEAPASIETECRALAQAVLSEQHLSQAPKRVPSLKDGRAGYEAVCSTCHGVDGAANTPMAAQLDPPPANFLDRERMNERTPYEVFNVSTFGIPKTGMASFASLPEAQRWAQAFHVMTLRHPPCDHTPPTVSLEELATSTDAQLASRYGEKEVACLRRALPTDTLDGFAVAQQSLNDALTAFRANDLTTARQGVVDAYLNGLEPMEPMLRARDPGLVSELEVAFTEARVAAQRNQGFEAAVARTQSLLERAQTQNRASTFWSVFLSAIFILLREGFEAVVVVGALLAVLKKMKTPAYARVVHAGWVSALVVGALLFVFAQAFFAGANREWMEAVVSLIAVGLLLYAALWLNARATMSQFMGELRGKMTAAIGEGSALSLFFISFSAVGRESVETALFLEGLAIDSRAGASWGAAAGFVLVVAMAMVIRTIGFRLPMKTLFSLSTLVLVVTAVVLLGKGLHGLQEVGVLPLVPTPMVTIDLLGLYPDATSLVPQLVLSLGVAAWRWRGRMPSRSAQSV